MISFEEAPDGGDDGVDLVGPELGEAREGEHLPRGRPRRREGLGVVAQIVEQRLRRDGQRIVAGGADAGGGEVRGEGVPSGASGSCTGGTRAWRPGRSAGRTTGSPGEARRRSARRRPAAPGSTPAGAGASPAGWPPGARRAARSTRARHAGTSASGRGSGPGGDAPASAASVGRHQAGVAVGREVLGGVEAEGSRPAVPADRPAAEGRAERLGGVLHQVRPRGTPPGPGGGPWRRAARRGGRRGSRASAA